MRPGTPEPWLYRKVRGLRPDRNPLRRRIDRVETYLLAGFFAAAAAGTPFAAQAASHAASAAALRVQQEQRAATREVRAVLSEHAPAAAVDTFGATVSALASWTSGTGQRFAEVPAKPGSPKGTPVSIWLDRSGGLASPPLIAAQVAGQGDAAGVAAVTGVILVLLAGTGIIHCVFNRRRGAAWDAAWLATAQTWNRQSW